MKIGKIVLLSLLLLLSVHPAFGQSVTLVTLGDSLTEGDGDDGIGGGYPVRLLSMLQALCPGSTLNNVGISGDTSDDLINKQLESALNLLNAAPAGNLKIALIWIGSNDLFGLYNYVCDEEYGNNYSACEGATFGHYSDNISSILTSLKATGSQIYIALLDDQSRRPVMTDPVLRVDSFPLITDVDVSRMSTQVSIYNDEIARLSSANGATTVDFFNSTIFENWATLSDDGNHPNGAGYDAIATIWYQAITGSSTPTAPTLAVTTSGTTVTVSWNTIVGATGYTLSYAPYPYTGPDSIVSIDMGTQTDISVNLWTGASFYIAVQAYNSAGSSGYSNIGYFVVN
jgi:lysophospholipase L1-like esterase